MGLQKTSAVLVCVSVVLMGCAEKITVHGYAPTLEQTAQIEPGVDTIFSLESRIGRPSTSGLLRDGSWYYIQSTQSQLTYNAPRIVDRRVVAVDYDADGVVTAVQTYGLEDGRIVNLSPRVTETTSTRRSILAQIFGNVFNVDAGNILNSGS